MISKTAIFAEPILVGRERELEELELFLNSAVESKGKTVFVLGEAGSGKTRLVVEFLNRAKRQGVTTLTGWCLSNAAVPYFPFFEAFNAYFSGVGSAENEGYSTQIGESQKEPIEKKKTWSPEDIDIMSWLMGPTQAEQLGKSRAISPQVWKDQTFAAVTKTLTAISTKKPIILFIDDLQWADSASLALVHYIARAINSEKVLLLATFRSEQLTGDAEGRPHPLVETLRLMKREDLFKEIKIASLNQKDVSDVAESMLEGALDIDLAEKLAKESQGNPLFIVESVRMLHENGSLIHEHDKWRLTQSEIGIPDKIRDIILQRLSSLTRNQRRVLDAASAIGERFDAELVACVLGHEAPEVIETLDVVRETTSLIRCEGELYRFDHASSRDAVYGEISPAQKRVYHSKIAEMLECECKDGKMPFSDLAYHYAQAGNKEKAIKYALAAAKDELARWSNSQAIKHFEYVLQNIREGQAEEKINALEGLGDAFAANYMYGEAIKTFDALAALGTGVVRLRSLRKAIDAAFLKGDKSDLLLEYTRKAEEVAVDDRLEQARVINTRARAWGFSGGGDLKMDLADYDVVLQIFEEDNSLADAADALWRSGLYSVFFEDSREKGLAKLLRSTAIFRELGDVRKEIEATLNTGLAFLYFAGLLPEARREYANVLMIGEKLDVFAELAQACSMLASFDDEGEEKLAEHVSQASKGLEYCKKTDVDWILGTLYATLTRLYSKLGDVKHADECFDRMTKLSPEILSHFLNVNLVALCKGVYFAAKDQWEKSNRCFEEILEYSDTYPGQEIIGRANYAWALEKQGRVEDARVQRTRVAELSDKAEGRFGHANVQLSLMVPRIVQVGEEFEMRIDLVNVGRKPILLVKIDGVTLPEFKFSHLPSFCFLQEGSLVVKEKSVGPFQVETLKLKLKATKVCSCNLTPEVVYIDDLGKEKMVEANLITITAQSVTPAFEVLPGRITTGSPELDKLLLGGIPEKYAVALASSSCDERRPLIKLFLEAGAKAGETTLYVTCEAGDVKDLTEQYQSNFSLIVCNLQADFVVRNLPNVYKLKGVDSLTDVDIALMKYFRALNPSAAESRRACIDILSDALLQHHPVVTRKWLGNFLTSLKSKGFTVLAVIDPCMHQFEEVEAILSLFDGEIRIGEKEGAKGPIKTLKILKLQSQNYLKDELILS